MLARLSFVVLVMVFTVERVHGEAIKIAYSGVSASGTPVWLAKDQGIFAKHGLEADLVAVRSAPLQVTALVSNEVQFVRGSATSMLTGKAIVSVPASFVRPGDPRANKKFLKWARDNGVKYFLHGSPKPDPSPESSQ